LESVRPAELHFAESEAPDMNVRWPHRQHACVPITRAAQLTIDQHYHIGDMQKILLSESRLFMIAVARFTMFDASDRTQAAA
jgi:hypothetical protein